MTCVEGAAELWIDFQRSARERLIASGFGRLLPGETVADLFCGGGGWTALGEELGVSPDFAVNHSPLAIEYHRANNPDCVHHQGDAWKARPREVIGKRTKLGLLLASAACTTHSNARGAAPISPRVHMLGWCIARWLKEAGPRVVLVENVPEWQKWGPTVAKLGVDGKPARDAKGRIVRTNCPERKGLHFRRWVRYCERLGYAVEWQVLDAANFGSASRRKRLFVQMRRDGQPILWPEASHEQADQQLSCSRSSRPRVREVLRSGVDGGLRHQDSLECERSGISSRQRERLPLAGFRSVQRAGNGNASCSHKPRARSVREPHRTAAEVIDWSDLGCSIFERKRPLADKTLKRIAEGIRRFVIEAPAPFVLRVTHGDGRGWKVAPVDAPMPTQTTRQDLAVVTPIVSEIAHGHDDRSGLRSRRADAPLGTVHAGGNNFAAVTPVVVRQNHGQAPAQSVEQPLGVVTTQGNRHTLVAPIVAPQNTGVFGGRVDRPGPTITTKGHQALISPLLATVGWGERDGQSPRCSSVTGPLNTVPAEGVKQAVIAPVMAYLNHGEKQSGRIDEPMRTVVAGGGHAALVAAFLTQFYSSGKVTSGVREPVPCVTTIERHALVGVVVHLNGEPFVIVDILFRMLRPRELAAAMGFPSGYVWPKSQRDAVKLIGNAVAPPMARALLGAVFPAMGGGPEREEVAA